MAQTKLLTDSTRKTTQKGGFSKLCVKIKIRCYTDKHWSLNWMQENQKATYFLRSRLFTYDIMKKISTAISIKHRILATFNIKKN
jgi:hypothetical protein